MIFSGPQETVLQMRNTWRNYKYFPVKISRTLCMWMGTMKRDRQRFLRKNGLKILNKLIQNPTGRKPKQWDLFYAPVPLFWITCWPEVSWDVSTRASSKFNASPSEELGNSALKTNAFFAVCLICQLAAFLQSSGNTHQDSKRMPSLTRSHQCKWCMIHRCITYRYITHKQMYYTQMYYTQRCIIHRISGQRNTQDSDWKQKAQKITKTSEKKACVCSQRITQLNVKRSLYAWLLPAPLSLWKRFGGVSNNLWTFQGVPQNQQSEDIPLQVKSSS